MARSKKRAAKVRKDKTNKKVHPNEQATLIDGTLFAYNTVAIPFRESAETRISDLLPRFETEVKKKFSSLASKYRPDPSSTLFYHPGMSHKPRVNATVLTLIRITTRGLSARRLMDR